MKSNKNGVKLLAAVMVFAMAFAGIAILVEDSSVAAEENTSKTVYVDPTDKGTTDTYKTLKEALAVEGVTNIEVKTKTTISEALTIPSGVTVSLDSGLTTPGEAILINGVTLTVNGTLDYGSNYPGYGTDGYGLIKFTSTSTFKAWGATYIAPAGAEMTLGTGATYTIGKTAASAEYTETLSGGVMTIDTHTVQVGTAVVIETGANAVVTGTLTVNGKVTLNDNVVVYNKGTVNGTGSIYFADSAVTVANGAEKTALKGTTIGDSAPSAFNGAFARINVTYDGTTYTHAYGGLAYMAKNVSTWTKADETTVVGKQIYIFGTYNLKSSVTIPSGVALKVQATAEDAIASTTSKINMVDAGSITLASGSKVLGTIQNGTEGSIKFGVLSDSRGMTLSVGSIKINGEVATPGASGDINITGKAVVVGDTKIDGNIVLTEGSTLTVPTGTTLDVKGITVEDNATIKVGSGANITATIPTEAVNYDAGEGQFSFGDTLNSDYTVTKEEYLSKDLVIPAGVKLTIATGGILNLAKHNILVLGELEVQTGATIAAADGTEKIFLIKNSTFVNDGAVGVGSFGVTISANTNDAKAEFTSQTSAIKTEASGSVTLTQTTGAEFSIVKYDNAYYLSVSGNVYTDDVSGKILINGAVIGGDLTIGDDVAATIDGSVYVLANVTLTVDGKIAPKVDNTDKVILVNKATFIANGDVDNLTVEAQTGDYQTSVGYATGVSGTKTTTVSFPAITYTTDENGYTATTGVKGITLTVGTVSYTDTINKVKTAMTSQRLYVSGELAFVTVKTDDVSAFNPLTIEGNDAYVADESKLIIPEKMDFKGKLVVEGQVIINEKAIPTNLEYVGTSYTITTTSTPKVYTTYIEPFTDAISKIDTVDKKTLTINDSKVKISDALTLTEGQVLAIGENTKFTVESTGVLTVNAKAKITGTIYSVEGILKIMTGGSCANAPTIYASYVKATDSVQYSGILVALNNAKAGDVITINNETTISKGDLVVKDGVTVNASKNIIVKDGNVDIIGKLVLSDNAKLDVTGEKKNISVTGVLNAVEGDVNIADGRVTSQGQIYILQSSTLDVDAVDGFVYEDDDGYFVITSGQAAINAVAAMEDDAGAIFVLGTISVEKLDAKANLVVLADKANLGDVTIADGKYVILVGETTATFVAQTGVVENTTGAIVNSVIKTTAASGIVIGSGAITDSMNITTKVMYIFGDLQGKAVVSEGTVTVGYDTETTLTVDQDAEDAYLTVASGATLEVAKGMTLEAGCNTFTNKKVAAVSVEGTLSIIDNGSVTTPLLDDKCYLSIKGTVEIGDKAGLAYPGITQLSGKIVVSETASKEGLLTVDNTIVVYNGGSITGNVTINDGEYIQANEGADLSKAKIDVDTTGASEAFTTVFYISGTAYMTVYTVDDVKIDDIVKFAYFSVDGLDLTGVHDVTKWFSSEDYKATSAQTTASVTNKDVPALYFNAPRAEVNGTISAGVGLQIYLNGVSIDAYKAEGAGYDLAVGVYTVTIENQYGYDKSTAVISFNGTTVANGGKITVAEDGFVLTATGATPVDPSTPTPTPVPTPTEKDDGMGITEYLLIVLVVLAAILVVVVAIRMMRS